MSITAQVGVMIPTNVVEVGNEISSDQLAAIQNAASPSAANHLATIDDVSGNSFNGGTVTNPIIINESATSGFTATFNGTGLTMAGGSMYVSQEEGLVSGFNIQLPVGGTITFGDSTTQTTAASSKKAIANLCASCLTTNGSTIGFTNYIAIAVIQGSKFQSGSNHLIGIGTPGGTPSTLTLTSSSLTYADAGMSWGSYSGQCVCYSDDSGVTWTYSDLSF